MTLWIWVLIVAFPLLMIVGFVVLDPRPRQWMEESAQHRPRSTVHRRPRTRRHQCRGSDERRSPRPTSGTAPPMTVGNPVGHPTAA